MKTFICFTRICGNTIHSRSLLLGIFCIAVLTAQADTLSNNLDAVTDYTEVAEGNFWITASFGTDGPAFKLTNVTLLLSNSTTGKAEVDLYTDVGGNPGSLLSVLSNPAVYTSDLSNTTFGGMNYTLVPNTTYWIVLKALSGSFEWAFTDDSSGSGVGFQHTWGATDNAGNSWFTSDIQPMQMSVTADPIPEPKSIALLFTGLAGWWTTLLILRFRKSRNWSASIIYHPAKLLRW